GLKGVHAYVRAELPVYFPARQRRERGGDGGGRLVPVRPAAVEDLDGRGGEQGLVVLREGDVAYVLRVLLRAERADGDALAGAHELHEAQDGVGVLVVAP